MSRIFFFIIFSIAVLPVVAQERNLSEHKSVKTDSLKVDSLNKPVTPYYIVSPSWYGYDWSFFPLHQGINASLSLSATIGFGSHHLSGVGFGRQVDFIYASPIAKQLSYTVGMNTSQMDWGGFHYNQAGIGGSLNYAVNDKVSLSLSGYKDLVHPQSLLPQQYLHPDKYLEGAVNMKFTPYFFLQVSFGTSSFSY